MEGTNSNKVIPPKEMLEFLKGELKKHIKISDAHAIFDTAAQLRDYTWKLSLPYSKSGIFKNDLKFLLEASSQSQMDEISHADNNEILKNNEKHLEKALNQVLYHLDSLIRNPQEIKIISRTIKEKKSFLDYFKIKKYNKKPKLSSKQTEKPEKILDDLNTESYRLLKKLESRMRQFIGKELSEVNIQWWKQLIPPDVKENAKKRKNRDEERKNWNFEKQDLINYIDFTDYAKIITQKNNWKEVFQYVFRDKNKIEAQLKEIEPIRHAISHSRDLDDLEERQMKFYSEEILRSISYYYDNKKKIMKEKSKIKEPITLPQIAVSFDRRVYPLHSTVHLRANMPKVIPDAPIIFQVFNPKGKLLITKEIIPEKFDNLELKNAGLYETSFVMEGDDWKVGEEYVLKGKHSTTEAKSFTRIDARKPVLESDKSLYFWSSDMILTIIDPDADKDNNVPEIAGDRHDSKLVIASSKGRIENYRLRETGDSTGIFQGILGFIGVNKDGTKVPYNANGKIVYETQGTEYDNGFLEVSENDELIITYENATGKAELIASVNKDLKV